MKLTFITGPQGSGKSTLAHKITQYRVTYFATGSQFRTTEQFVSAMAECTAPVVVIDEATARFIVMLAKLDMDGWQGPELIVCTQEQDPANYLPGFWDKVPVIELKP